MARPERFELPTPWFEGRFDGIWVFINQSLAALANPAICLSTAQLWHSQFEEDTTAAQRATASIHAVDLLQKRHFSRRPIYVLKVMFQFIEGTFIEAAPRVAIRIDLRLH